jgi:hypothetical protein
MRLTTVIAFTLLLAVGILLSALALEEPVQPRATWRVPVLNSTVPTPTPADGWWEDIPTPFSQATPEARP